MANLPAPKFDEERDKFEVANLGALAALEAANSEVVDLDVAENLRLITVETRDKIRAALPNHELLFQRALAKERRKPDGEMAFRRAFEVVYGKFIMEQGDEDLEASGSPLMKKLSTTLKFPVGPTSLKGRTELRTAVRRLRLHRLAGGDPNNIIKKAFATSTTSPARNKLERDHESVKAANAELKGTATYFGSDNEWNGLKDAFTALDTLLKEAGIDPADPETLNTRILRLEEQVSAMSDMRTNQKRTGNIDQQVMARFRSKLKQDEFQNRRTAAIRDEGLGNDDDIRAAEARIEGEMKREIEAEIEQGALDVLIEGRIRIGERRGEKRNQLQKLQDAKKASETLYAKLKVFFEKLAEAKKANINFARASYTAPLDVDDLETRFKAMNLSSTSFNPNALKVLFEDIGTFFGKDKNRKGVMAEFDRLLAKSDDKVAKAKKKLDTATSEVGMVSNLTDAQAAKRLIAAMVAEQNLDMLLPDQQKLASMILANDVATIQTETSYAELAQRGSAEVLDTVQQAGFKRKLIDFQYKENDKVVQPFKDLKPEQFNDWAEIETLFRIGRLNYQNGFFVLAAMKEFAPTADGQPIPQIQAVKLERKLKVALAEELGVDERMDEAGINQILNKAFADQARKAEQLVKAYFQHFERNQGEWDGNKIRELDLRYAKVKEELSLGRINDATFQKRMAALVKEAKEGEVLDQVKFSEDSAMAGYWNSPFAQWFKDRGWDAGKYVRGKAKSVAVSGVKLGAFGLWGATKLGLSATLQTALLPFRAAKYPLLLAVKPVFGIINLFRGRKLTPLPTIRETIRSDAGRVVGYFKTKGGETWKGAVGNVTGVPKAEWKKTPYAGKDYKARTNVDLAALEEQAKELKATGDATPVEVAGSPFIDLKKYRAEIAQLDKILAGKPAEERGDSAVDKRAAA